MSRRPPLPVVLAAVVCAVAVSRGGCARGASETPVRPAAGAFTGAWKLDVALSDDPVEKMREAASSARGGGRGEGGGGRGGFGGGGRGGFGGGRGGWGGGGRGGGGGGEGGRGAEAGRESSGTPNEVLWDEHRLVVTDGGANDPRFVVVMGDGSARTLYTDGRKVEVEEATGTTKIKAKRKGGKVVVDTEYPNGREVKETWELLANPRLLVVTTKVSGKRGSFSFKRVFDSEPDAAPAPAGGTGPVPKPAAATTAGS